MPPFAPLTERFWRYVSIPSDTPTFAAPACWPWTAMKTAKGYGQINSRDRGVLWAHRVAWEIHSGPIPTGMQVLHRCDNPPCVNPAHLFLGTNTDNMADCDRKRRRPLGSKHWHAKLDENTVRIIRENSGETQKELARRLGVAESTICEILSRKAWTHVQ